MNDSEKTNLWLRCLELALQHRLVQPPGKDGPISFEAYAKAADGIMEKALKAGSE